MCAQSNNYRTVALPGELYYLLFVQKSKDSTTKRLLSLRNNGYTTVDSPAKSSKLLYAVTEPGWPYAEAGGGDVNPDT